MCGIAGIVGGAARAAGATDNRDALGAMIAALAARGPDGEGVHVGPDVVLGHRRLAVIDVAGGAQPLYAAGGQIACVANGEIYGFAALRAALAARGHRFVTGSDCEVIAHGYAEWGSEVCQRLEGQFAFAVWDARRRTLLLARDRMGEKPLYWARVPGGLAFASELRALLRHPALAVEVDREALARYLVYEHVPAPRTIIRGISKLEPGTLLEMPAGGEPQVRRWWQLPVGTHTLTTLPGAARAIRTELERSVRERLVADVPLGVFLSGGLDSTLIAALAARARDGDIDTFSIGFEDPSYDESAWARRAAEALGVRHRSRRVSARDLLALSCQLGALMDEPTGDGSLVPTHLLARFAREHVTVCLGGDGGDELFSGYPTFTADAVLGGTMDALAHRAPRAAGALRRGIGAALARLPASSRYLALDFQLAQLARGLGQTGPRRHQAWLASFLPAEVAEIVDAPVATGALFDVVDDRLAECPSSDPADRLLWLYARGYLGDGVLAKVDRASMAVALEVRAPMLDSAVIATACRVAPPLRARGLATKIALKEAARGLVPDAIIARDKHGFGMPIAGWLRGPLADFARDTLSPARLRAGGLLRPGPIGRLLEAHIAGRGNHRKKLWTLLALQLWLDDVRADRAARTAQASRVRGGSRTSAPATSR